MNKKKEIFTIGDKTTLGIITCFRLLDNEIMVDFDNKNSILLKSKQLQHAKQPLFTTEDGVDISEGDDYWVYDYGELKGTTSEIHKVNRASQTHTGNGVNRKYFSTKENAEKYVLMNEPCLSVNDILRIGIIKPSEEKITFIEQVKYLVKEKLNGNK